MKKVGKVVGAIAIVAMVLCAVLLYWTTWSRSTKEIESVANEFRAKPEWTQVTNEVEPERTVCLEGDCPSVHRSWKVDANLTKEDLRGLLDASNWVFSIEGDCIPKANVTSSGGQTLCSARGVRSGYSVHVVVLGDYGDVSNGRITLFIDK